MKCRFCDSVKLRISRFHASDIKQLMLFRYPVRCRGCLERYYVRIPQAFEIRRASKLRHREDRTRRTSS